MLGLSLSLTQPRPAGAAALTAASIWDGQTGLDWQAYAAGALWQDTAATTLADDPAEVVGRINDQKPVSPAVNGTQTTAANRPTFGKTPLSTHHLFTKDTQILEDSSTWTLSGASAVATTDPTPYADGTFWRSWTDGTSSGIHQAYTAVSGATSIAAGSLATVYMDFKAGAHQWVQLSVANFAPTTVWANFNLTTGAVGNKGSGATTATTIPLPGGGYRCIIKFTTSSTTNGCINIFLTNNTDATSRNPSYVGTSGGVYVGGSQLYLGHTDKPYQRVISAFNITQPAIAGVQDAATSYGLLRFDASNDALAFTPSATLTSGAYTIFAAGRSGIKIVTGTTTLTGGVAQTVGGSTMALPGSGLTTPLTTIGDLVELIYISKLLTSPEQALLVAAAQANGAGALLP